jgi:hypothetical protein
MVGFDSGPFRIEILFSKRHLTNLLQDLISVVSGFYYSGSCQQSRVVEYTKAEFAFLVSFIVRYADPSVNGFITAVAVCNY